MTHRHLFVVLMFVVAFMVICPTTIQACSCGRKPTVLDAFERSGVVLIARVVSLEKTDDKNAVDGVRSVSLVVEKSFKGDLKVGHKMVFHQGGGANCIWTFSEHDMDRQYLFYLSVFKEHPNVWLASTCGRSRLLDYAGDDLLFLNNISSHRGKTRLSGSLSFYQASATEDGEDTYKWLGGKRVRIVGKTKTVEVTTNQDGVFEIYDLPADSYEIQPEIPTGWRLDRFGTRSSTREVGWGKPNEQPLSSVQVNLEAGKHAYVDFDYQVNNSVRGTVADMNGNPMKSVCVGLIPSHGKKAQGFYKADCTEDNGAFLIDTIPAGSYVVVVNSDGKISSDEPFPTFYFPNVLERDRATIITIGEGENISDLNIRAPSMRETMTIEGVVLYSNGKPVVEESVQFEPEKPSDTIEADSHVTTDDKGRFSLKVLKGIKGHVFATMWVQTGDFKNCPKVENLIKATGEDSADLKTSEIRIDGDRSVSDVNLKFSFPSCAKAND